MDHDLERGAFWVHDVGVEVEALLRAVLIEDEGRWHTKHPHWVVHFPHPHLHRDLKRRGLTGSRKAGVEHGTAQPILVGGITNLHGSPTWHHGELKLAGVVAFQLCRGEQHVMAVRICGKGVRSQRGKATLGHDDRRNRRQ